MGRLLIVLLVAGCAGRSPGPRPADPAARELDQAEYELLDRLDALGRTVEGSGGRCDRLASGLDAWFAANRADLPTLMAEARTGSNLTDDELGKIEERVDELLTTVVGAVERCRTDPGARTAWTRVDILLES